MKRCCLPWTAKETWDVIVIGGGATGLGTALEAASRGYRTALLEAEDFAKATSSRSTKLIHGGVRYLRSGQVRMVRESLRERGLLLKNAPHIVHPLKFVIPTFQPAMRWYFFAGMKLYDQLAGNLDFEPSELLSKRRTSELLPNLKTNHLCGGVRYSDGQFDDSRLAVALAMTFADHGGVVVNYAPVTRMKLTGRLKTVGFVDQESSRDYELTAKAVVNATGVFSDRVMALDDSRKPENEPKIVASQGTHLVLDRSFLASENALMIPKTDDGRVLFAIPWHDRLLLGTTDEKVQQASLNPKPMEHEIDYLLTHAGRYLKTTPQREDILSMFAGLRPLVGRGNNASTSRLSREHEIHVSSGGLISVIGGKWTTYRKMGEDVVNLAAQVADLPRRESVTANLQLVGCPQGRHGPAVHESHPQFEQFGDFKPQVERMIDQEPALGERLHARLPYLRAAVVWAMDREMARTVEDVLSRRTRALLLDARAAGECAADVAELMRQHLGRNEAWKSQQLHDFQALIKTYLPAG